MTNNKHYSVPWSMLIPQIFICLSARHDEKLKWRLLSLTHDGNGNDLSRFSISEKMSKVLSDVILSKSFRYIDQCLMRLTIRLNREKGGTQTEKRSKCKRIRRIVFVSSQIELCVYISMQKPRREKVSQHTHAHTHLRQRQRRGDQCLLCQNEPEWWSKQSDDQTQIDSFPTYSKHRGKSRWSSSRRGRIGKGRDLVLRRNESVRRVPDVRDYPWPEYSNDDREW